MNRAITKFSHTHGCIIRRMAKYKKIGIIGELNLTAFIKFRQIKKLKQP